MRDGIASLLSIQDGIEIVGDAGNGQEAVEKTLALQPDVVLMDVRMPVLDGVGATAQIRRQLPTCQVIMLTTFDDEEYIIAALQAGASGYLLKDIPVEALGQAIKLTHKGIYQLEPSIAGKLLGALVKPGRLSAPPMSPSHIQATPTSSLSTPLDITEREIEVLRLIATGASNRNIAERLVISEGTVKNHVSNILSRLGLRDRTQAALFARDHGLV